MKKIFTLFLFSISLLTTSQNKIEGLGEYKINKMTILSFQTYVKSNSFEMDSIKSYKEYSKFKEASHLPYLMNKKVFVAEVVNNSIKKYGSAPYSNICKNSRVFYIPATEIAKIKLVDTFLTFFNDTLVRIDTDYNYKIANALKLKYGKPEITNYKDTINCVENKSKKKYTKTEESIFKVWKNGNINCTILLASQLNNKCEETLLSSVFIELQDKNKEVQDCNKKERDKRSRQELEGF